MGCHHWLYHNASHYDNWAQSELKLPVSVNPKTMLSLNKHTDPHIYLRFEPVFWGEACMLIMWSVRGKDRCQQQGGGDFWGESKGHEMCPTLAVPVTVYKKRDLMYICLKSTRLLQKAPRIFNYKLFIWCKKLGGSTCSFSWYSFHEPFQGSPCAGISPFFFFSSK